jgi:hypothetical protein
MNGQAIIGTDWWQSFVIKFSDTPVNTVGKWTLSEMRFINRYSLLYATFRDQETLILAVRGSQGDMTFPSRYYPS